MKICIFILTVNPNPNDNPKLTSLASLFTVSVVVVTARWNVRENAGKCPDSDYAARFRLHVVSRWWWIDRQ